MGASIWNPGQNSFPVSTSNLIRYKYPGSVDSVNRTVENRLADSVSVKDFGAVGDGAADDTAAIQTALDAAKQVTLAPNETQVTLAPNETYRITSRIDVPSGVTLSGHRSSVVTMDTGAGHFDNTNPLLYDTANGVAFKFSLCTGGGLSGFRIRLNNRGNENTAMAVLVQSSLAVRIHDCEFDNFSKTKIIRFESSNFCEVLDSVFHDCELSSSTTGQLTAIDIDDNRPTGSSSAIQVQRCVFRNLICSPAFIASFLYQTDAINVSHESSSGHIFSNNVVDTVGEGIDVFGSDCVVSDNVLRNCYLAGIKVIHGARRNTVTGNNIFSAGLYGIVIAGVNNRDNDTAQNIVSGNTISLVNAAGNFSANSTSGIRLEDDGGNRYARSNYITNNKIQGGTGMKYGILSSDGSRQNVIRDNDIRDATIAEFLANGSQASTEEFKSGLTAVVRGSMSISQSVPAGSAVVIEMNSEEYDRRNEYDPTQYTYTASVRRIVNISAIIRTASAGTGILYQLGIYKNGLPMSIKMRYAATAGDFSIDVSTSLALETGDIITFRLQHGGVGSLAITADSSLTNFSIVET